MYEKFSDDELIEAYNDMMDYSGQPNSEMVKAIETRGGIEAFKKKIEHKVILTEEMNRVSKEVFALTSSQTDPDFIKKMITSDVLSKEELSKFIEHKFNYYQSINENKIINSKTIISSIVGAIAASIVGAVIFGLLTAFMTPVFIYFIVPVYIIDYLIIRLITRKTRANIVVFLAALFATIGSIILGGYFATFLLS